MGRSLRQWQRSDLSTSTNSRTKTAPTKPALLLPRAWTQGYPAAWPAGLRRVHGGLQLALAGLPNAKPETGETRTVPGTINALCSLLLRSTEWTLLAADTRDGRRRIVEKFRLTHGRKRVDLLSEPHLVKIMSDIASPSSRRSWLKAIKHLLAHAVPTMIKMNPAAGIAHVNCRRRTGITRGWTIRLRPSASSGNSARNAPGPRTRARNGKPARRGGATWPQHSYVGRRAIATSNRTNARLGRRRYTDVRRARRRDRRHADAAGTGRRAANLPLHRVRHAALEKGPRRRFCAVGEASRTCLTAAVCTVSKRAACGNVPRLKTRPTS